VAIPAALFGLGPTMQELRHPRAAFAAPPAATKPPSILTEDAKPVVTSSPPVAGAPATPSAATPTTTAAQIGAAPIDTGVLATISAPGTVRAVAAAADAVVVAVDTGAGTAGRVVVLDADGVVARDQTLVVNGVPYQQPGGVAVTEDGVLVSTATPAAVLRIDPNAGTVTKVADLPDVALCLPVLRPTNCQAAVPDSPPRAEHLAVSDAGDIFVADRGQACILRIAPQETKATAWLCDVSFAASPAASAGGLSGLAIADNRLVFTVAAGFDGSDSVQEVTIASGAPANRRQLAAPPTNAGTAGVVVLPDGRVVAALADAGALFVVTPDGSSRSVKVTGITGPIDIDVIGDTLFVAHRVDGAAGRISRRPLSALA
jgi:hypothetical protein